MPTFPPPPDPFKAFFSDSSDLAFSWGCDQLRLAVPRPCKSRPISRSCAGVPRLHLPTPGFAISRSGRLMSFEPRRSEFPPPGAPSLIEGDTPEFSRYRQGTLIRTPRRADLRQLFYGGGWRRPPAEPRKTPTTQGHPQRCRHTPRNGPGPAPPFSAAFIRGLRRPKSHRNLPFSQLADAHPGLPHPRWLTPPGPGPGVCDWGLRVNSPSLARAGASEREQEDLP
jgi:hypothetical protein